MEKNFWYQIWIPYSHIFIHTCTLPLNTYLHYTYAQSEFLKIHWLFSSMLQILDIKYVIILIKQLFRHLIFLPKCLSNNCVLLHSLKVYWGNFIKFTSIITYEIVFYPDFTLKEKHILGTNIVVLHENYSQCLAVRYTNYENLSNIF